jgi:hypothetical protein
MRIAVIGSSGWRDGDQVIRRMRQLSKDSPNAIIVTRGRHGVDTIAERAAMAYGLGTERIPEGHDWQLLEGTKCIEAFLSDDDQTEPDSLLGDDPSGTKLVMLLARVYKLPIHIHNDCEDSPNSETKEI